MKISECREEDLALLEQHMPTLGAPSRHALRFARHAEGTGTYLVAWYEGVPVGSCEVRWDGCAAPEIQAAHPGYPEVNGLGVWPGTLRSQGIGTALIRAAEERASGRGAAGIGLGVEKNNPRAEALYKRLGYRPATPYLDCWSYQDGVGVTHRVADACTFLVKELP
ncbi:GNAT family N-acetyltransferase [Streptomyces sp. HNM0574]|uniref:GNAT family N-acetyltransferase n=1 Tax=Streptomyces sp. HNM0574 TaxID=2714954 RepID=UPI00146A44F2|nr:GNAT family N-acetyltransferase [Streptomyces sp. HNM0574]NLU65973.1 GNAT family N-acetyltransferase [Streptomyces sp. HNM0574]